MSWKLLQVKVSETETVKVIMTWMMDGTLSGTNILLLEFRPNVLARDASNGPIHSPAPFSLLSGGITSGGRQEGLSASLKQRGLGSIPLRLSFLIKKVVVCGHSLVVTLSLTIDETLKWLSSLPILMQESFWWWQCSDWYILSLFPHLHTPSPFSPSLISLIVSVEVKHHVYQRASTRRATDLLRSLQSSYHVTFLSCLTVRRFPKLQ